MPVRLPALFVLPSGNDISLVADGIVRLYRNYDPDLSGSPVQMVSSFRGLNELLRMKRGAGLVTEWKQSGGSLLVGGDSRFIRVWEAHTENPLMVSLGVLDGLCVARLTAWGRTWRRTQRAR